MKTSLSIFPLFLSLLLLPSLSPANAVLTKSGISFNTTHFGVPFMGYPILDGARESDSSLTNKTATLTYTNGVQIICTLATNTLLYCATDAIPSPTPVSEYKSELHLSSGLGAYGTRWRINDTVGAFPRDIRDPDSGKTLFHGTATTLTLLAPSGATFSIIFPESLFTLVDKREYSRVILTATSPSPPTIIIFGN